MVLVSPNWCSSWFLVLNFLLTSQLMDNSWKVGFVEKLLRIPAFFYPEYLNHCDDNKWRIVVGRFLYLSGFHCSGDSCICMNIWDLCIRHLPFAYKVCE
jgi:hypothetical protein